jgi:hypothetical protein
METEKLSEAEKVLLRTLVAKHWPQAELRKLWQQANDSGKRHPELDWVNDEVRAAITKSRKGLRWGG